MPETARHPTSLVSGILSRTREWESRRELLHGDALVERMLGIEQQRQRALTVEPNLDARDLADLDLVGDGGHGPVCRLEYRETDGGVVGQDRSRPTARAEGA